MGKVSKKSAALSQSAISARFRHLRAEKGASQSDFAVLVGTDQKEISLVENGKFPSTRLLDGLISKLGIDAHWLLTGEGPMLRPEQQPAPDPAAAEQEAPYANAPENIVAQLRRLTAEVERLVQSPQSKIRNPKSAMDTPAFRLVLAKDRLSDMEKHGLDSALDEYRVVPILADPVAAGAPLSVWEAEISDYAVFHSRIVRHPEATSCVAVRGDSMSPIIPDGSLALVDHTLRRVADMRHQPGRLPKALIRVPEGDAVGCVIRHVRQIGKSLICTPENPSPDNPEFPFDLSDPNQENPIAGQVIWWGVNALP